MTATDPRYPDRQRQWSPDDREERVRRRREWGSWAATQPRRTWNGVDHNP